MLTCGIIGEDLVHSGWVERAAKMIRLGKQQDPYPLPFRDADRT